MQARLAFAFAALLVSGCATMSQAADSAVALGQTARVAGLRITPTAVIEDSRCPMNARCIWAGRAIVRATVGGAHGRIAQDFTLGEAVTVEGRAIVLDSVAPARMAGRPATPRPYRFHFSLSR